LEENDEVVPDERSLPVLSPHLHLFEAVLFTQLSGRLPLTKLYEMFVLTYISLLEMGFHLVIGLALHFTLVPAIWNLELSISNGSNHLIFTVCVM
jgi:hypothetical protein